MNINSNPYIGPRPYERNDRNNFYGRKREARDLLSLILSERAVLFYAQSGAGKTSLLNAQIVPALEAEGFRVFPVARVGNPLPLGIDPAAIHNVFVFSALLGLSGGDVPPEQLVHYTLQSFLEEHCREDENPSDFSASPLVIFDQFEELFTTHREHWFQAREFFREVSGALAALPRLGMVFAMREDYVAEMDSYLTLVPNGLRTRFRMERLGKDGAIEAVAKPAQNCGMAFDAGVAERLVENLQLIKVQRMAAGENGPVSQEIEMPGPYVEPVQLQVVCSRLWENLPEQPDRLIQWADVEQYGNLDGALADFYLEGLKAAQKESGVSERQLRRWFSEQLITPMRTRGLVMRDAEATAGLPNAAVDVLERRYLIRADLRGGVRWYELVHDRMIEPIRKSNREWETARETPLRVAARQWQESKNAGLFFREEVLVESLAWAAAHPDEMEPFELEFLAASRLAEQRRNRTRRLWIGSAVAGGVVLLLVSYLAWLAGRGNLLAYSREMAMVALVQQESNHAKSVELAREAVLLDNMSPLLKTFQPVLGAIDQTEAEMALRRVLLDFYPAQHLENLESDVPAVLYMPDDRGLYLGLSRGEILTWDFNGGGTSVIREALADRPGSAVWTLALSPDGKTLLAGGDDGGSPGNVGGLEFMDVETGQWSGWVQTPASSGFYEGIYSAVFSADGKWVATGGQLGPAARKQENSRNRGMVRIWALTQTGAGMRATPAFTLTEPTMHVNSVAFSSDGKYLAAGSYDNLVYVWGLQTSETGTMTVTPAITLAYHTALVRAVAFGPYSEYLASASRDKTIRVYLAGSWQPVRTLVGHKSDVTSLAFSPLGDYLISGSRDATVRLWSAQTQGTNVVATLTGPLNVLSDVAFSRDGQKVAGGTGDGTVWSWDLSRPREGQYSTLSGQGAMVRGIDFGPDGTLASGDNSGQLRIWSMERGGMVQALQTQAGKMWNLEYSPDGRYIVTCSDDKVAEVWNSGDLSAAGPPLTHSAAVNMAAFSPDGAHLVTVSDDGLGRVWETQHWSLETRLETQVRYSGGVFAVAYSPDGRWIATGHTDDQVRLWQVQPGSSPLAVSLAYTLTGHTNDILSLDFSPDGKLLASGSWDNRVLLWNMGTFTLAAEPLEHSSYVYSVAFSPDRKQRMLAVGTRKGSVYLWDLDNLREPQVVGLMKGHSDLIWRVAISPDGKTLASSSWDGTIRRYPLNFEDVLNYANWLLDGQEGVSATNRLLWDQ